MRSRSELALARAYWQDLVDRGYLGQEQAVENERRWLEERRAAAATEGGKLVTKPDVQERVTQLEGETP